MSNHNENDNSETQLCLINLFFKLKMKLENELSEDEIDFINSNAIYRATPEEITQKISKMVEKCFIHYCPEIQQSNLENSLCQNSKAELASEYETMIQKLEAEVRSHIRLEQQLKLHADSLQAKIEENEKIESSNKQTIQKLNDEIKQLKSENKVLRSENAKYKDKKNDLEKKVISFPEKINQVKGDKIKTRVESIYNISESSNKSQVISTKKHLFFESRKMDKEELLKKTISRNNLENNKIKEKQISVNSINYTKENNFLMSKSQLIFPKRNLPDQKTVTFQIGVQRKRNSESIGNEMNATKLSLQKPNSSIINSNIALKRIINGKTQNSEVYKTINHKNEPQEIQTERQKASVKESVVKNKNSASIEKFKNTKRKNFKNDRKSTNQTDSNKQSIMDFLLIHNTKDEENGTKNDECSDSIGREANVCEQNFDVINRRARSITYQFGGINSKLPNSNSNIFCHK